MKIETRVKIINSEGSDLAYFMEQEDLYSKLSGVKDPQGDYLEFIEIGQQIELGNEIYEVEDINLMFEGIALSLTHFKKNVNSVPKNLMMIVVITVKYIRNIIDTSRPI